MPRPRRTLRACAMATTPHWRRAQCLILSGSSHARLAGCCAALPRKYLPRPRRPVSFRSTRAGRPWQQSAYNLSDLIGNGHRISNKNPRSGLPKPSRFFTAKQAKAVGYFEESMVYHVKAGNWIREHRGIYRLSKVSPNRILRPDAVGICGPATATKNRRGFTRMKQRLALHELSDVNPEKLHMTVPKGFRRNSDIPDILHLHVADVRPLTPKKCMASRLLDRCERSSISQRMKRSLGTFWNKRCPRPIRRGLINRREIRQLHKTHSYMAELAERLSK